MSRSIVPADSFRKRHQKECVLRCACRYRSSLCRLSRSLCADKSDGDSGGGAWRRRCDARSR